MAEISSLGYLCVASNQLAQWEAFAVDVLGMQARRSEADGANRVAG